MCLIFELIRRGRRIRIIRVSCQVLGKFRKILRNYVVGCFKKNFVIRSLWYERASKF